MPKKSEDKKEKINKNFWICVQHGLFLFVVATAIFYLNHKAWLSWDNINQDFVIYFVNWLCLTLELGLAMFLIIGGAMLRWYD